MPIHHFNWLKNRESDRASQPLAEHLSMQLSCVARCQWFHWNCLLSAHIEVKDHKHCISSW